MTIAEVQDVLIRNGLRHLSGRFVRFWPDAEYIHDAISELRSCTKYYGEDADRAEAIQALENVMVTR